ncbi:MAG: hypothetical protein CFE24_13555 [Flavobacterium sp. BFFFF2]|nr:MAG: hypothetical protein CFE24_13555 [Flavobacterium sp. BFFFF2]
MFPIFLVGVCNGKLYAHSCFTTSPIASFGFNQKSENHFTFETQITSKITSLCGVLNLQKNGYCGSTNHLKVHVTNCSIVKYSIVLLRFLDKQNCDFNKKGGHLSSFY